MTERGPHRVVLEDFKASKADQGAIEVEANGTVFRVDPPELWPDEVQKLALAGDNTGMAQLLVGGPDRYSEFVAAGGSANLLAAIIQDVHGLTPGNSPASSGS